jgi:hypothetical protein
MHLCTNVFEIFWDMVLRSILAYDQYQTLMADLDIILLFFTVYLRLQCLNFNIPCPVKTNLLYFDFDLGRIVPLPSVDVRSKQIRQSQF